MNIASKNIVTAILVLMLLAAGYSLVMENIKDVPEISLSDLVRKINAGEVEKVVIRGDELEVQVKGGEIFAAKKEPEASFSETLYNYGVSKDALDRVSIDVQNPSGFSFWLSAILPFLLPFVLIVLFFWLAARQVQRANVQAFTFGQSRARVVEPGSKKEHITFKDIAGVKEAKEELQEIVEFLRNPAKFLEIGARIPRGVLLMGPPGSGKCIVGETLLYTNKGLVPIDEVPKYFTVRPDSTVEGLDIVSLDPKTLEFKQVGASHWYELGQQKTV
ncbi:MAG: ATP-dependent metallopeptidase FtsH/Yme1/Tma family protein, partial [Patescibacteria group bacterium]